MILATLQQKRGPRVSHFTVSSRASSPPCSLWRIFATPANIVTYRGIVGIVYHPLFVFLSRAYFYFLFLLAHLLRVIEFLNTGRYVLSSAASCFIVISSTCTCRFPYTSCRYLPDCWSRDWFLPLIKICIYCEKQKKIKVWVLCMVFPSDLVDESK